jgi:beta-glucanase (GH16 family)
MMKMTSFFVVLVVLFGCKKGTDTPTDTVIPKISIEDLTVAEGTGGSKSADVRVRLDKSFAKIVTVQYSTADGTAKANDDYIAVAAATLTFQPGETEKMISVSLVADEYKEVEEQLSITLSNAANGSIFKATGSITITDDDTKIFISNAGYDAPASYAGYTRVWSDEFDGTALNTANWSNQNGDGCPNLCGWGNNELEYYTDRSENIFFQDGKMIIEARKENFGGKQYTSSKIVSAGKRAFKFGRIDIRAKLPKGKGIWPALWLLPQENIFGGWPKSGELDLMELVGHEPNKTYGTIHYGPGPGSTQISRGYTLPGTATFNDEFHVFSLEWKQDQIKWLVDGNVFSTVNKADFGTINYPFNEQFYFIINLAVGGNWPGNPDANTTFPQWLMVDYIRVYQ